MAPADIFAAITDVQEAGAAEMTKTAFAKFAGVTKAQDLVRSFKWRQNERVAAE